MSPRWISHALRRLLWKDLAERDLRDEVDHYIEMATRAHMRAGMPRDAAERQARIEFGGVEAQKERVRAGGWESVLETSLQDVRYAIRGLRRNPAFATIAVLMLGIGIGSGTALFSVADEVFLKSLPVREPEQLVLLQWTSGPVWIGGTIAGMSVDPVTGALGSTAFSQLTFEQIQARTQTLASAFAFTSANRVTLSDSTPALAQLVSGNYFAALGVQAAAGRLIVPDDDRTGAPSVAVISHRFWRRHFSETARSAIGRPLTIITPDGPASVTIVGVSAPGFLGTQELGNAPDISIPRSSGRLVGLEGKARFDTPWYWPLRIMGRLRRGATYDQVRAELQPVLASTALEGWSAMPRRRANPSVPRLDVTHGGKGLVASRRALTRAVQIMAGIVVLVLLIVCTNLSNLLLARGAARHRELAVRAAVGASRPRLVRQLLLETILIACLGGALGIGVAYWGKDLFLAWIHRTGSATLAPELDARVLWFSLAITITTAMVVGVGPALRATRLDLGQMLKEGVRSSSRWRTNESRSGLGRALVAAQIAISMILVVSAGLLVRTVRNLQSVDVGFDTRHMLLFTAVPRRNVVVKSANAQVLAQYDDFLGQLGRIPGVRAATYSQVPLLSGGFAMPFIYVPGRAAATGEDRTVGYQLVHPTFLDVMGMPVLLGRSLTDGDRLSPPRVLVNESLAKQYFPHGALGRRIGTSKSPTTMYLADSELVEIVGVARDAKFATVREKAPPTIFGVARAGQMTFELRAVADPMSLAGAVTRAAQATGFLVENFRTQEAAAAGTYAAERHLARLTTLFGGVATLLACLGLYGLMAYQITRRTHEIGVRVALGARRGRVLRMVLSESMATAVAGVAVGLIAAFGSLRMLTSLLYGLSPTDPATFVASAAVVLGIAALAGLAPALRAAGVDPAIALRQE